MNEPSRRAALTCMLWAGSGVIWTLVGRVPRSRLIGDADAAPSDPGADAGGFSFMQISDSHIGFAAAPNMDTPATLQAAVDLLLRQKGHATLLLHIGDVSQLSKPAQFDTAEQIIKRAGMNTHYVPGKHDVLGDDGRAFFARFTADGPRGWYSWDEHGVHFVGLSNVQNLKAGGMGSLGADQLAWLRQDLAGRAASQPIVVFAHVPLWTMSEAWGWGTQDAAQALSLLARFGSVTVLNGHIHQVMQEVEGNLAFHTALHRVSAAGAGHGGIARADTDSATGPVAVVAGGGAGERDAACGAWLVGMGVTNRKLRCGDWTI